MESINIFKGYGKVNLYHQLEYQSQTSKSNPKPCKPQKPYSSTLTISAIIICLTLVITLIIAALIHVSNRVHYQNDLQRDWAPRLLRRLHIKVNASPKPTQKPSLSSLEISVAAVNRLSSLFKVNLGPMTRDCVGQLEDMLSRLNDSVSIMVGGKELTEDKINEMQKWIRSTLTNQEMCLDGLKEMGSTIVMK